MVAIPLAWALARGGGWVFALGMAAVIAASIPLAGRASRLLGHKDPKPVVIDEIAGYLVAMWGHPATAANLAAAFFLFRLFDVAKPFPCRRLESLPGGWGIVLDDLMAGLYASAILYLARSAAW